MGIVSLLTALSLSACGREIGPASITLLLDEAAGLKAGDPVTYRDVSIGTVREVELTHHAAMPGGVVYAHLAIERQYLQFLSREQDWVVEGQKFLGLSPEKEVGIHDRRGRVALPLQDGDRIVGTSYMNRLLRVAGEITTDLVHEAAAAALSQAVGLRSLGQRLAHDRDPDAAAELSRRLQELGP